MKQHRTALGKTVDMQALIAKNERTRAVGNMNVNARGDTIDANGRVVVPVTQKVGEKYQKTVGHKSAMAKSSKPQEAPRPDELALDALSEYDDEIEQIKAKEKK